MSATRRPEEAARETAAREESPAATDRLSVLLVDPHAEFRSAASALLDHHGLDVIGVGDAADAATVEGIPDCVVVDPGVGGEVEIRRAAWLGLRSPVVLVTGAPPWALPDAAWTVADAYVEKGRQGTFCRLANRVRAVSRATHGRSTPRR
ncbi:response regulator [Halobaculum gomorrense]|uniref:Response regulatory domain-containing protein n=1 Tax=Halobaculum gomorrense TaxID=43928 RepID=A0A1M5SY75_9EURY|nr:response regulator [Halobaculum gomorrense]SHH43415.1 hypothetical protein SAMN05443636_2570 [Halobaculum gomorrense]